MSGPGHRKTRNVDEIVDWREKSATIYYVGGEGNDTTGDGTMFKPFKTVQVAVDYVVGLPFPRSINTEIRVTSGIANDPIEIPAAFQGMIVGFDSPWFTPFHSNISLNIGCNVRFKTFAINSLIEIGVGSKIVSVEGGSLGLITPSTPPGINLILSNVETSQTFADIAAVVDTIKGYTTKTGVISQSGIPTEIDNLTPKAYVDAAIIGGSSEPNQAIGLYVTKDRGNDITGDGSLFNPFATIQAAVDYADTTYSGRRMTVYVNNDVGLELVVELHPGQAIVFVTEEWAGINELKIPQFAAVVAHRFSIGEITELDSGDSKYIELIDGWFGGDINAQLSSGLGIYPYWCWINHTSDIATIDDFYGYYITTNSGGQPVAALANDTSLAPTIPDSDEQLTSKKYVDDKTIDADKVNVDIIGTPTYDNLENLINLEGSSKYRGIALTAGLSGTLNAGTGSGQIRISNSEIADLVQFNYAGVTGLANAGVGVNWVYMDYNSGTPILKTTLNFGDINHYDKFMIGRAYWHGSHWHIWQVGNMFDDFDLKECKKSFQVNGVERAYGLTLSETGTRNIAIELGAIYCGVTETAIGAFDSNPAGLADTFTLTYRDGSGGWTEITGETQINNLLYDDSDGTPGILLPNRYGVHWVYEIFDGEVQVQLGQGNYTLTDAQDAQPPATSQLLGSFAILVGKIIIKQADVIFTSIQSTADEQFSPSGATLHDELGNRSLPNQHPASAITNTPSGDISATDVQAAINELDSEKATPADITSDISTHAAIAAAHHAKYLDSEAVSAMGAKGDSNPLNHDRPIQSTESIIGIAELATQTETDAGTDDLKVVTPLKLKNWSGGGGSSIFGSAFEHTSVDAEDTNITTTGEDRVDWTTSALVDTQEYRIGFAFEGKVANPGEAGTYKIIIDGVTVDEIEIKDNYYNGIQGGFYYYTADADATIDIKIQYNVKTGTTGTAYIKNARVELWRVA